ncbi:T3SS effector HopA1 family protein [Calothrix sp. NIES-2098]|uniref:T3SS effector HopA1 family protein n=1 Tax=Calothrix sp. NIES-2098 TaxID=1954171 RepID=UPI000B60D473|nr:hypothetical protein NIES2098_40770 [Calothrix sp. NIES-2098]
MLESKDYLKDITTNIKIDPLKFCISHSYLSYRETSATTLEQLQKLPLEVQFSYFNSQLLDFLYQTYFKGLQIVEYAQFYKTNEQILEKIASQEIDWEFYEKLDKNNQGKGWFHPAFHLIREEADGSLAAEFDDVIINIQRKTHLPPVLQSASINDAVSIFLPSSYIGKYNYHANGDNLGGLPPYNRFVYTILVYFNFSSKAAIYSMNCVTTKLNAAKIPFVFHVLHNPLNYRFYNSGVLKVFAYEYNPDIYKDYILPVLQTIYAENKYYFREEVPIFTKKIAPGIGLAERPNTEIKLRNSLDSEGNYCEFVADALLEAYQNNDNSPEKRMKYILRKFEQYGIDIERPYLNPNAEDIYTPLV